MNDLTNQRIIITGGAGLVGQNLVAQLKQQGCAHLVVLDKHQINLSVLRTLHPDIVAEYADLAEAGDWQRHFKNADAVVMLQAQIGGNFLEEFERNNVTSTKLILQEIRHNAIAYTVHVSSSVVVSVAQDYYSITKRQQESLVLESGIPCAILRPTLMFGWFDRKHLGWLARFMKKTPVFPVPGDGRYIRQPLYSKDFCNIIINALQMRMPGTYNISGLEKVDYIDIICTIKKAKQVRAIILKIPYGIFYLLLKLWALWDRNPPFTTQQLEALVIKEEFEIIDWPTIFDVVPTPFTQAIDETFNDPVYSSIQLEF